MNDNYYEYEYGHLSPEEKEQRYMEQANLK